MKIFLAQQNYHIGNIDANTQKIIAAVEHAKNSGGDLIVFSELSFWLSYVVSQITHNVVVYGPLRVFARTIPSTNLRENSAGIFKMSTDQAMVYTRCCKTFFLLVNS